MEEYSFSIEKTDYPEDKLQQYQEYCKLSVYNKLLEDRFQELLSEKERLSQKFELLQDTFPNGKPKRFRRNADQINRIFKCNFCDKSYGSEASMKNHLKFKHQEYQSPEFYG